MVSNPRPGTENSDRRSVTVPRRALVTGITGQDGSYLTELPIGTGYEVHGLVCRSSTFGTERIDHLYRDPHDEAAQMFLHFGGLTDAGSLEGVLLRAQPYEIYNLGAQPHVAVSFENPVYTADATALGTLWLL
jgi:GDPmannose 4,6-dehydratase